MKLFLKKSAALLLAATLVVSQFEVASAASIVEDQSDIVRVASRSAADYSGITGANILDKIRGEYVPMFDGALFDPFYNHYWHDSVAAVGGASKATENETTVKHLYSGVAYGPGASASQYFCNFANDIVKIIIGGDDSRDISFIRKDGIRTTYRYKYVKDASISSGGLSAYGFLFESMDGVEDGFKYFYVTTDTPSTTYHIEFRYADTEADVLNFADGPYKNCLSYGISSKVISEKNEAVIEKAIAQIVYDTLPETPETNEQRGDLVGVWDYNFSTAEQNVTVLDSAKRFIKNAVDGTGAEYRDALGTGNYDEVLGYKYFVYDATPEDAVNSGTYLRYIPGKGIQVSAYSIGVGGDGRPVVTFKTTGEQDASYTYRGPIAPDKVAISAVKAKGKKISISWSGTANASRYQVVVSTSKKFKKLTANKSTDKTSITIKVKKKKTYYVKVRGYAEDAFGGITYGDYSGVKKVKVK